jgi:acyl-CoA synthetase (NDP forming)
VRVLLAAPEVDAVLAVFTETLIVDSQAIAKAVSAAAVDAGKPLQIVEVGSAARSIELPGFDRTIPVYAFPEPAAVALGHAVRYARMRSRAAVEPDRSVERDEAAARQFVVDQSALGSHWLGPEETAQLLGYYGIATCEQVVVDDVESALRAAVGIGYPVAAKLSGPVVHKSDIGGVRLGLTDEVQLRDAVGALLAIGRGGRSRVLIQPMVGRGVEIIVGAMQDARFGPVVMVGAGGVLSDLVADRALRLAPLSTPDAREMTDGLRCAVLFDGYRGQEPVSRSALWTLLLKVSALIEDLAEVAELDLNPVICCGDSLIVVDAKVRVAPTALRPETVVRRLRG